MRNQDGMAEVEQDHSESDRPAGGDELGQPGLEQSEGEVLLPEHRDRHPGDVDKGIEIAVVVQGD